MCSRPLPTFISLARFTSPLLRPSLTLGHLPKSRKFIPLPGKPPTRLASQWGRSSRPSYRRFGRAEEVYALWNTNPSIRIGVGLLGLAGGAFYVSHLEYVPVSGRRRFNFISPEQEAALAAGSFDSVMQKFGSRILPPNHPSSMIVNKVAARLLPVSGLQGNWEVRVIAESREQNAFVIPGGKIFVFSGILPLCAGEDGLAHVLAHEIGHTVAHHSAESLSKSGIFLGLALAITLLFDVSGSLAQSVVDVALSRPNSRTMESEADHIGLLMVSKACYDPQAGIGFWQRMAKAEQHAPPQFLSTHPASKNRIIDLQKWLPEAQDVRSRSECASTTGFVSDFREAYGKPNYGLPEQRKNSDDDFF